MSKQQAIGTNAMCTSMIKYQKGFTIILRIFSVTAVNRHSDNRIYIYMYFSVCVNWSML